MEIMTMKMTHSQKIKFLLNQKISEHQLRLVHLQMTLENYQGPQYFYNKVEKKIIIFTLKNSNKKPAQIIYSELS